MFTHLDVVNIAALRDSIREYYIKVANNEALGGLPADNGWVLRGLQNDTLGLHEFVAMNISRGAGWWAPRTQYIEVKLAVPAFCLSSTSIASTCAYTCTQHNALLSC